MGGKYEVHLKEIDCDYVELFCLTQDRMGCFEHGNELLCLKQWGISLLAEPLLASQ
jgi:hypothetical protein